MRKWRALTGLGPWWLVALVVAGGLTAVAMGHIRSGGYVAAGGVALAAVLRAVLPAPRGGGLEIRSRWLDVLMLVVATAALVAVFTLVRIRIPPV
ncbi:DUF3017 domain-containing protein [Dermatophilaceae bacterium Soc4.6]